jgi:glycosyltransferase involved in cell wall biosynthesis
MNTSRIRVAGPRPDAAIFLNAGESRTLNFMRELRRRGWLVSEFRCLSWAEAARGLWPYARAARRSRFVVAGVAFPWQAPWLLLARALGLKIIIDCPMDVTVRPFSEARHLKRMLAYFSRRADLFLTIASRSYLTSTLGLDASKVLFLETCPDLEQIGRSAAARPRFEAPAGDFLIGYSGVAEWQRPERFVPIFKALRELVPNVTWLVVSDPDLPMIRRLRERAEESGVAGGVRFLPVIKPAEDFFATMARCDLWVGHLGDDSLLGRHELRMELLEMGALSRPAVCARTPALELHGFADGDNLILINPDDPAASARRLADYLSTPGELRGVGERLRRHVLENFSLTHAVDELLAAAEGTPRPSGVLEGGAVC